MAWLVTLHSNVFDAAFNQLPIDVNWDTKQKNGGGREEPRLGCQGTGGGT